MKSYKPELYMVSDRPNPWPKWTPEEDEQLLKLKELCCGKWEIPHLLSRSAFDCAVRYEQLREQQMQQQDKEPSPIRETKRPRTSSEVETQISKSENDLKEEVEDLKKQASDLSVKLEESEMRLKLEIAAKLNVSRVVEMHALEMVARMAEMLEKAQATYRNMVVELDELKVQSDQWRKAASADENHS